MSEKSKFRIIFQDYESKDFSYIYDIFEWRYCQNLTSVETLILKFGYINTLKNFDFENLYKIFSQDRLLQNLNIEMSLFMNANEKTDKDLLSYEEFILNINKINPKFNGTLAWLLNYEEQPTFNLHIEKSPILKQNLYLHNFNDTEALLKALEHNSEKFNGIDVTGFINHINPQVLNNNLSVFETIKQLEYKTKIETIKKVFPEYLESDYLTENNYNLDLEQFCKDGYKFQNKTISPIFYGSFDNFTLLTPIDINQFLLNDYNENLTPWKKELNKIISKSFCFTCEKFEICKNKKYYYQNLYSKQCSLGILKND